MRLRSPAVAFVRTVLAALLVTGCAQRTVIRVPIDEPVPGAVADPGPMDLNALLGTVARAVKRLGLPLSSPVHAYLYETAQAFELGLVTEARSETWFAKDQASFAVGVGTAYGIFLRADKLAAMSMSNRAGHIAHELTHVSQYELAAGRRGVSDQWLREGFADWVRPE